MKEEKEEILKKKYMQLQMLGQHIQQIQKQIQQFDAQDTELTVVKQSLEQLEKEEAGKEMFVPVSGGIFVKAELKDNKKLLVNVGADITVEKSVPDTIKLITTQIGEVEKYKVQMMQQLDQLSEKAKSIQQEMGGLVE